MSTKKLLHNYDETKSWLYPNKFKVEKEVEFGGTHVKYSPSNKRVQISPSEEKAEELLGKEPPKTKKIAIHFGVTQPVGSLDPSGQMQDPPHEKTLWSQQQV